MIDIEDLKYWRGFSARINFDKSILSERFNRSVELKGRYSLRGFSVASITIQRSGRLLEVLSSRAKINEMALDLASKIQGTA